MQYRGTVAPRIRRGRSPALQTGALAAGPRPSIAERSTISVPLARSGTRPPSAPPLPKAAAGKSSSPAKAHPADLELYSASSIASGRPDAAHDACLAAGDASPASLARASFAASLDPVSSVILRNLSRLGMDLFEQKQWSKVFLVVERGAGTSANPYNGTVIDCSNDACSVDFEEAFMREWWTQRRPFLAAEASNNGPAMPPPPAAPGSRGALAPPKAPRTPAVPAGCPSLEQHSPGVMQSLKDVKIGTKTLTEATINAMLLAMGMTSINQVLGKRLRSMSSSISATMDARTAGDVQWSWSRIVPIDMLLNNYRTEDKKVEVTLFSLFPAWHRDASKLRSK